MEQKITLSLEESHIQFIEQHAKKKGTTVSKIVDDYLELLQKIDEAKQKKTLHPWVQEFGGMVNTGKEESIEIVSNNGVEKNLYNIKNQFMAQGIEHLEKEGDVEEIKSRTPEWLLAGFKNEDEYNDLLKKIKADLKTRELHPWVKEVSGMISTGREETKQTIFEDL